MASIHKEIVIDARPENVWAAVRDVGAIHTRLARGFVVDTRLEDDARVVTFANGSVVRERIVDLDDDARRLTWAAVGEPFEHHNASMQIYPEGQGRSRAVWIADLLPHELAGNVGSMMDQALKAVKSTLEGAASRA
jgi:hypothetical protein